MATAIGHCALLLYIYPTWQFPPQYEFGSETEIFFTSTDDTGVLRAGTATQRVHDANVTAPKEARFTSSIDAIDAIAASLHVLCYDSDGRDDLSSHDRRAVAMCDDVSAVFDTGASSTT